MIVVIAGAWTYHWIQEDAFINVRVIDNLLAGHGPVYNLGERVEVYSDPLWLYLVALVHVVLPFFSVEWCAVLLGLAGTGLGVTLAGRAVQRLGASRHEGLIIPFGLLIFSVVGGVWEFSTSGLEMGLVFLWIGLSFWLVVRTHLCNDRGRWCAVVVGLGPLIRPELALMVMVFLVTLGAVVYSAERKRGRRIYRHWLGLLGIAFAAPAAYEVFRMAYFAMIVPNTALAKSAGGSEWTEGLDYLWNFVAPYTLWLPLCLAAILMAPFLRTWWSRGDRVGVAVAVCPLIGGILEGIYVVKIGGDYMHARLLLPSFCAVCTSIFLPARSLRKMPAAAPAVGIALWAVTCLAWLRVPPITFRTQAINDERSFFVGYSGRSNPMVPADFDHTLTWQVAHHFQELAADDSAPQRMQSGPLGNVGRAKSSLPFRLAVTAPAAGVFGVVAGPRVYVFDALSLANPIGSHTNAPVGNRQGKILGPAWMIARFSNSGSTLPEPVAAERSILAARRALRCSPLSSYLHAITAPTGFSQLMSNVVHAFTYTTMRFSPEPEAAATELCGP
ncbi:MAG: hypothetical protein ACRDYE_08170 [Acidimicrobiales bacterium]